MSRMSHTILSALFIYISIARNAGRSSFDWSYDGDLTLVLDFANEYIEDESKFIIFGSYAAHLASHGLLPYRDIDIVQTLPSENRVESQSLDLHNGTMINYHGRVIDLKAGSVPSLDHLLDAANINAVSVAFEFEKIGNDDIRLVKNLKDQAFDEFMQTRTLKIVEPQRATANDCIRILSKAERYGLQHKFDPITRENCERPQILNVEKAKMAQAQITGAEFANRVFSIEGSYVWARNRAEAEEYLESENRMEGGRRALWNSGPNNNPLSFGYYEEGEGKCVTDSGADPSHMYFHGIGEQQCRLKCDYEPACWGFSVSIWGNCLHWMQDDIKAGGAPWGGAKCWIAQGVVDNGRRSLQSAQNSKLLLFQDRRALRTYPISSGFYNVGHGKCVTSSGGDPAHNYFHGVGEETCRSTCMNDSQCYGFSVSIYGNCLHWMTNDLQESGGPVWGGANCWLAQTLVDSKSFHLGRRKN